MCPRPVAHEHEQRLKRDYVDARGVALHLSAQVFLVAGVPLRLGNLLGDAGGARWCQSSSLTVNAARSPTD